MLKSEYGTMFNGRLNQPYTVIDYSTTTLILLGSCIVHQHSKYRQPEPIPESLSLSLSLSLSYANLWNLAMQ